MNFIILTRSKNPYNHDRDQIIRQEIRIRMLIKNHELAVAGHVSTVSGCGDINVFRT